jgi:hypothetical protein
MGKIRSVVLIAESEGRRPLGRSRHRSWDNIKISLKEVGFCMWIGFMWLRSPVVVSGELVKNLRVP